MSTAPPRLVVELREDAASFGGVLRDRDGTEQPFSSWLEFLSLVESWRSTNASVTGPTKGKS